MDKFPCQLQGVRDMGVYRLIGKAQGFLRPWGVKNDGERFFKNHLKNANNERSFFSLSCARVVV